MQWHRTRLASPGELSSLVGRCYFSISSRRPIKPVRRLRTWDLEAFRSTAFQPALPAKLPSSSSTLPPGYHKWYVHHDQPEQSSSELNLQYWQQHQDLMVPIELTQAFNGKTTFHRSTAPLKLFLDHSSQPTSPDCPSLYIAQCSLSDLPSTLQADLPTPELVNKAGRGDLYDSSLWMGRPPTFTPLHRDPNPNLFMQLAGQKVIRLFTPDIGRAVFEAVSSGGYATFRGEEMMQGDERQNSDGAVWGDEKDAVGNLRDEGFEAELSRGEALFIPQGWWHSVRGVGTGMNASVNWWFR